MKYTVHSVHGQGALRFEMLFLFKNKKSNIAYYLLMLLNDFKSKEIYHFIEKKPPKISTIVNAVVAS